MTRALAFFSALLISCSSGVGPSPIEVAATRLDFGEVKSCATVKKTFTVTNLKEEPISIEVPPLDFFVVEPEGPQPLGAFGILVYEVSFTGLEEARSFEETLLIKRVGVGVVEQFPVAASSPGQTRDAHTLDFLGVNGPVAFSWPASFRGVTFEPGSEPAFSVVDGGVVFTPSELRTYEANLVGTGDNRCPVYVKLRGDGVARQFTTDVSVIRGIVGSTNTAPLTFRNFGPELLLSDISISPGADLRGATEFTVAPATRLPNGELQSTTSVYTLTFSPTTPGPRDFVWSANTGASTLTVPIRAIADP
ncbi:MAG: hypothetical protein ACO1OB_25265 [Archangium sp.]